MTAATIERPDLFTQIKTQAKAVEAAECAFNYASTPEHADIALEILTAENIKLNALWKLAKVEVKV